MLASDGLKNNPLSDLLMGPDEEEDEPEEEEEESEVRVSRSPDNTRLVEKREQYKEQVKVCFKLDLLFQFRGNRDFLLSLQQPLNKVKFWSRIV